MISKSLPRVRVVQVRTRLSMLSRTRSSSHWNFSEKKTVILTTFIGTSFAAKYCDYNFTSGVGVNEPTAFKDANARLVEAAKTEGRDVGALVLLMVIADETDEAAQAKFELYNTGIDHEAQAWMRNQSGKDIKADEFSTAKRLANSKARCNGSMGTLIGSYASIASMLDEVAQEEVKGVMLTFDDFVKGVEDFGTKIQPLMKSRVNTVKELSA